MLLFFILKFTTAWMTHNRHYFARFNFQAKIVQHFLFIFNWNWEKLNKIKKSNELTFKIPFYD